ncbi:MAG: hypothetical protein EBU90_30900 [Proteobacteria bacterium]|nr:hypothetical protein [Pseudomonadota bacterium]NBP16899.1 hypothetical protein [bacterium]
MPVSFPTSNNAMVFFNRNVCRSFNQSLDTNIVALTSQPCSEIVVYNVGSVPVLLFDSDYTAPNFSFIVPPSSERVLRGITNANTVSARTTTGTAIIYYRTQYYSNNTIGVN